MSTVVAKPLRDPCVIQCLGMRHVQVTANCGGVSVRSFGMIMVGLAVVLGGCTSTHKHDATVPLDSSTGVGAPRTQSSSVASTTPPVSTSRASTPPTHTSSTHAPSQPHTTTVVLRPVTAKGYPAPGFTVVPESGVQVLCGPPVDPSPGAVDGDILECSPSAEYAVACWPSHRAGYVLCLRDPWSKTLAEIAAVAVPKVAAPAKPRPLAMMLSNGTRCDFRNGGAWNSLEGHPGWYGTYSCASDQAVWGQGSESGIDTAHPQWTVSTAPLGGNGPLVMRTVATAYFVGTL